MKVFDRGSLLLIFQFDKLLKSSVYNSLVLFRLSDGSEDFALKSTRIPFCDKLSGFADFENAVIRWITDHATEKIWPGFRTSPVFVVTWIMDCRGFLVGLVRYHVFMLR